jgi:hypothetical protein
MDPNDHLRVKMSDLPKLLVVEGPHGEEVPFEIKPKRDGIGVFLNKVPAPIWKFIKRK